MNNIILEELDKLIPNPKCSLDYKKDYELLIAVMLSAQSTDKRVNEVTPNLFKYSLEEISKMREEDIENIIRPVGTFHRKAQYVKAIANILFTQYNSVVPHDRKVIESLPGVGHKTCNVIFAELFHDNTIAVDTHVTRVANRLNIVKNTSDVLKIEKTIMKKFPEESWSKLHLQLVLFGRHKCKALKPDCNDCPFKDNICTYKK